MSAYMPVKHSWGIEAVRPSRKGVGVAARVLSVGAIAVAAVTVTLSLLAGVRDSGLALLPSSNSGTVLAQSASAERDHGFIVVQGEAVNQSTRSARGLEAVVELFDEAGALRGVESALVQMPVIGPREESAFVVRMPDPGDARSFRVRFRSVGGAVLP